MAKYICPHCKQEYPNESEFRVHLEERMMTDDRIEETLKHPSKLRPANYAKLTPEEQWEIDKKLGILDWEGEK